MQCTAVSLVSVRLILMQPFHFTAVNIASNKEFQQANKLNVRKANALNLANRANANTAVAANKFSNNAAQAAAARNNAFRFNNAVSPDIYLHCVSPHSLLPFIDRCFLGPLQQWFLQKHKAFW